MSDCVCGTIARDTCITCASAKWIVALRGKKPIRASIRPPEIVWHDVDRYKLAYTVCQKGRHYILAHIFAKYWPIFTLLGKFEIKLLIKIPPHLKCVATLPCEILVFANRVTFGQSLMVSVGMSKLWCTHLIFVDPGAKINGCYYREVLLSQQLLPAIRQVSGDFFVLQVTTRQCTGAHDTRDNQAAATRDARIHLTWSVASE